VVLKFSGVRVLALQPTPNLEDQGVWLLPFDLSGLGVPASSYATTGIALGVMEAPLSTSSTNAGQHQY